MQSVQHSSQSTLRALLIGAGTNWSALYAFNLNVVGGNPNLIYPGQDLYIPWGEEGDPGWGRGGGSVMPPPPPLSNAKALCESGIASDWLPGGMVNWCISVLGSDVVPSLPVDFSQQILGSQFLQNLFGIVSPPDLSMPQALTQGLGEAFCASASSNATACTKYLQFAYDVIVEFANTIDVDRQLEGLSNIWAAVDALADLAWSTMKPGRPGLSSFSAFKTLFGPTHIYIEANTDLTAGVGYAQNCGWSTAANVKQGIKGDCDHPIGNYWEIEYSIDMLIGYGDTAHSEWTGIGLAAHEIAHNITWADGVTDTPHGYRNDLVVDNMAVDFADTITVEAGNHDGWPIEEVTADAIANLALNTFEGKYENDRRTHVYNWWMQNAGEFLTTWLPVLALPLQISAASKKDLSRIVTGGQTIKMKRRVIPRPIGFIFVGLMLSTCAQNVPNTNESQLDATLVSSTHQLSQTDTPNPTLTSPSTIMPSASTLVTTPGPSSVPVPTPAFGAGHVGNNFLFGNQPLDCKLPCWQGLTVGKSDTGDIQTTLDRVFGFNGSYDFVAKAHEHEHVSQHLITGYYWELAPATEERATPEFFGISAWIDESSGLLAGLQLAGSSQLFEEYTSPQHVLREVGTPSSLLVAIGRGMEDVYQARGRLTMLYYDKGLTIYYPSFQIFITRPSKGAEGVAELCLDTLPPSGGAYRVEVYLTEPFDNGLNNMSAIQEYLIADATGLSPDLRPFEDVFGLSLDEVTALAQQNENACVSASVP